MEIGATDVDQRNDDAERVWLQRVAQAPDMWRSRASGAAGLLTAAAAATMAGLLLHTGASSSVQRGATVFAGTLFVISVACYLTAVTWPSPKADKRTSNYADELWEYCQTEIKPIKGWMIAGTGAGILAILGVTVAAVISGGTEKTLHFRKATVSLRVSSELAVLCPSTRDTFTAFVAEGDGSLLHVRFLPGVCGPRRTEVELSRVDIAAVRFDGD